MIAPATFDRAFPPANPEWVARLPDGAVSVGLEGPHVVLRASEVLQARFQVLLERKKAASLTEEEARDYAAICELDEALSLLNRIARGTAKT